MPHIAEALDWVHLLGFHVWQVIALSCFGHCQQFKFNIFWDGDVVCNPQTKTFTFSRNLYAKLRRVSRDMCHVVNQTWKTSRGFSIAPRLVAARHQSSVDFGPIARITAAYLNKSNGATANTNYQVHALREFIETREFMGNDQVDGYFQSIEEADDFCSRLNTEMLYTGLTSFFNLATCSDHPSSVEDSNHVGRLLLHGFLRDADAIYTSGGLRNTDASVGLIFGVLKRILDTGRILSAWTWTQLLPLLFEYAPHVQQWKDMQGFTMFCYLMHQKTDLPSWELFSQCIYYAASEMGGQRAVIFVDSNEFGELLTVMLNKIAPIWQDNTGVLLSLARLLAAWRLQHPDLEPPATVDLQTVVMSACCMGTMQPRMLEQPARALCLDAEGFKQDDAGYLYPMSDALEKDDDLGTIESGFFHILHTGDCVDTAELHLQVLNSFVLWLLSRFPASQLRAHAEDIRYRMGIWGCDGEDEPYIVDLRQKLH